MTSERLLYILPSWPKWSETFLRQDLKFLLDRNLPILPVALFPGDCQAQPDWPAVKILSAQGASSLRKDKGGSSCWKRWLPRWFYTVLSLWHHRKLVRRIVEFVQREGITRIHVEFADLPALVGGEAARQCKIPFSVGIHAADVHSCAFDLRWVMRGVGQVVSCNQAASEALGRQVPALQGKIHLLSHGVNLQFWNFVKCLTEELNLVFVGRFVAKKGIPLLLEAMVHLPESVKLTLIGEGPLEEELRSFAAQNHISHRLHWTGRCSPEEVRGYLLRSRFLVMPSVVDFNGNRDGIPNVVLEAMASGIPVVGSRNGSLPEVLTTDSGWPYAPDTSTALAAALKEALSADKILIEQKREAAYHLVCSRFDAAELSRIRAKLLCPFLFEEKQGAKNEDSVLHSRDFT